MPGKTGCDTTYPPPFAILCVDDSCNDCDSVWFDGAGYRITDDQNIDPEFGVEAPIDPEFGVDPPGPPQNCLGGVCPVGDGAYCDDSGNCLLLGKCTTKDDCFNLYNDPYPASMCIGDIICQAGLCIKDCDPIMEEFDCSNPNNAPNIVEVVCMDKELSMVCDLLKDSKNKEVYKWLTDPKK